MATNNLKQAFSLYPLNRALARHGLSGAAALEAEASDHFAILRLDFNIVLV